MFRRIIFLKNNIFKMITQNATDVILSIERIERIFSLILRKITKQSININVKKASGKESIKCIHHLLTPHAVCRDLSVESSFSGRDSPPVTREKEKEERISVTKPDSLKGREFYDGIREMPVAD